LQLFALRLQLFALKPHLFALRLRLLALMVRSLALMVRSLALRVRSLALRVRLSASSLRLLALRPQLLATHWSLSVSTMQDDVGKESPIALEGEVGAQPLFLFGCKGIEEAQVIEAFEFAVLIAVGKDGLNLLVG